MVGGCYCMVQRIFTTNKTSSQQLCQAGSGIWAVRDPLVHRNRALIIDIKGILLKQYFADDVVSLLKVFNARRSLIMENSCIVLS